MIIWGFTGRRFKDVLLFQIGMEVFSNFVFHFWAY